MSISFFQRSVLEKVRDNTDKHGISFAVGPTTTRDALIRKGLIERMPDGRGYRITDAGRRELDGPVTRDTYGARIDSVIKTCSCKRTYTLDGWKALEFRGYYDDNAPPHPDHPEWGLPKGWCELRNCVCGSTILMPCKEVDEHPFFGVPYIDANKTLVEQLLEDK